MPDGTTVDELTRLRAQVAALTASKAEAANKPAAESPETGAGAQLHPGVTDAATSDSAHADTVQSQLDELMKLLDAEIRELPTITCLAVFSLGILMGRLLR